MILKNYKIAFTTIALIGVLLIATPALSIYVHLPSGTQFSDIYLLGPNHLATGYPFDITVGQNYTTYVVIANHLVAPAYYIAYVKLRNQTDLLPNVTTGMPSPVQPLYEYRSFLGNGENCIYTLTFSFPSVSFSKSHCLIKDLTINNSTYQLNKPATWDSTNKGFYYELLVELWVYNSQTNKVEFNQHFVGIYLNMTMPG